MLKLFHVKHRYRWGRGSGRGGLCPLRGEGKGGRGCFGGNSSLNIPEKKFERFEEGVPWKKFQKKIFESPKKRHQKKFRKKIGEKTGGVKIVGGTP